MERDEGVGDGGVEDGVGRLPAMAYRVILLYYVFDFGSKKFYNIFVNNSQKQKNNN